MKGKKAAFANTSTGYGRKHNNNGKTHEKKETKEVNDDKDKKKIEAIEQDKDLNSGFGDYLRTPEAVEMMKLFVFANTIMLIVTMAWPNIKEHYYQISYWLSTFKE